VRLYVILCTHAIRAYNRHVIRRDTRSCAGAIHKNAGRERTNRDENKNRARLIADGTIVSRGGVVGARTVKPLDGADAFGRRITNI